MKEEHKTIRKSYRLTQTQADKLTRDAQVAGMDEADYLRALISRPQRRFAHNADLLGAIYRSLKSIGVNMNQLARVANTSGMSENLARAIHAELDALAAVRRKTVHILEEGE